MKKRIRKKLLSSAFCPSRQPQDQPQSVVSGYHFGEFVLLKSLKRRLGQWLSRRYEKVRVRSTVLCVYSSCPLRLFPVWVISVWVCDHFLFRHFFVIKLLHHGSHDRCHGLFPPTASPEPFTARDLGARCRGAGAAAHPEPPGLPQRPGAGPCSGLTAMVQTYSCRGIWSARSLADGIVVVRHILLEFCW